jgi:hypothetical protein
MQSTREQKTSPIVSLHLAYFAVEIILHKAIILALSRRPYEGNIVDVCRNAARERVITATDFVKSLSISQLQSFWYFGVYTWSVLQVHMLTSLDLASGMNLVYIGTFTALLFLTSRTIDEAKFYKGLLGEYRWTLRVTSRAASFVDFAIRQLDTSLLHLERLSPEDIVCNVSNRSEYINELDENNKMEYGGEPV